MKQALALFLILIILFSSYSCSGGGKMEKLKGKKIVMIIAPENFRDEEYQIPKEIFESYGISVTTASTRTGRAKGMLGAEVNLEYAILDLRPSDFDAVVVVGGVGSREYLWNSPEVINFVKKAYELEKIVAAICLSPVVLAKAGILRDKKATVYPDREAIELLKENGANYTGKGVEVDGRIVTGNGPKMAKHFAEEIVKLLEKQ